MRIKINPFINQQFDDQYTHKVLRVANGKRTDIRYRGTEKTCRNWMKLVVKNNPLPLGEVVYCLVPKEYNHD